MQSISLQGCCAILNWVSSYVGVLGKEVANDVARTAAGMISIISAVLPSLHMKVLAKRATVTTTEKQH